MVVKIKLLNPYIKKVRRVESTPYDILGEGGQQMNEGYTGPFIDLDTKEEFTLNLAGWAEVSVEVESDN